MAILEGELGERVEELRAQSSILDRANDQIAREKTLLEAWELFPEPKGQWDESYHIASYLVKTYLKLQQPSDAKFWITTLFNCDVERPDFGEREVHAGVVEYELGNFEEARRYFTIADKESKGRNFRKVDAKYYKFYKEK